VEKLELGASTSLSTFKKASEGKTLGWPQSQENMGVSLCPYFHQSKRKLKL
jgi:hypothetical protein